MMMIIIIKRIRKRETEKQKEIFYRPVIQETANEHRRVSRQIIVENLLLIRKRKKEKDG
jgi:hypothetical protein